MRKRQQTADVVMAMLVLPARGLIEVVASYIAAMRGPDEAATHLRDVALSIEKPSHGSITKF